MSKKTHCPKCGSKMVDMDVSGYSATIWKCKKCGYSGPVVVEDGNIEKQLKEARKIEKLRNKIYKRR